MTSPKAKMALAVPVVALAVVALSGCTTSVGGPILPTRAEPARYQLLYTGVSTCAADPQIEASTSLSTVEIDFPVFGSQQARLPSQHELFVAFRLYPSGCASTYHPEGVTRGPGALVSVLLKQITYPAALGLPVALPEYVVVELPLRQFPSNVSLKIQLRHQRLGAPAFTDTTYVRLAGS